MTRTARVWKRILAFIIDLYLSLVVSFALLFIIAGEVPASLRTTALTPVAMAAVVYAGIFLLLYHTFSEYIVGQTPGMLLFGLFVKSKKPLRFWQAVVRNLFMIPVIPFTLLWIIEPIYYAFQGERLLEHLTNTETVEHGINH